MRIYSDRNDFLSPMLPDSHQQLAIQARLNMLLGAKVYDELFLGFECGVVFDHTAHVYVDNERKAALIEAHYGWHVSVAVESILKLPIKAVQVLPRDFSDSASA
jgi:hypothetical protein